LTLLRSAAYWTAPGDDKLRLPKEILVKDIEIDKYFIIDVSNRKELEEMITRIGIDGKEFLKEVPLASEKSQF